MRRLSPLTAGFLLLDLALLIVCVLHTSYIQHRARAPLDIIHHGNAFVVDTLFDADAAIGLSPGDTIVSWNGQPVLTHNDPEFHADFDSIGSPATVGILRNRSPELLTVHLIEYYPAGYIILSLVIGIVSWGVGVFLLLVRGTDRPAIVLHWALVNLGVTILITWGIVPEGDRFALFSRVLFFFSFMSVVAVFVLFTTLFPPPKPGSFFLKSIALGVPALTFFVLASATQLKALLSQDAADHEIFRSTFHLFHIAAIGYIALGVFNFIHSYRKTDSLEERKKLKWVLWALSIGPAPFVFLTLIPELFLPTSFVPEEYTLVFFIVIPIAFAISFLRYHILNVEVVIHRTTVYAFTIAILVGIYLGVVALVAFVVGSRTPQAYAIAAVLAAVLFDPGRKRVQRFVDRQFFRVRYNFREAERRFLELMKLTVGVQDLGSLLIRETQALMPIERVGFFLLHPDSVRLYCVAHDHMPLLERRSLTFEPEKLKTRLQHPVALDDCVEAGIVHESGDTAMFNRWGIALVIPMLTIDHRFLGFFVLGRKKSGGKFSIEDVDLLCNVAQQAAQDIERIRLQQDLLAKAAEARHLLELNDLKTTFVQYVSHEFKTPLGGIKIHSELLLRHTPKGNAKARRHLAIIDGEVERLNRMVMNILDAARIDSGGQIYHFAPIDLRDIARKAVETMEYLLNQNQFEWVFQTTKTRLPICADPDAVHLALTNLIGNSIKYYGRKRYVKVSLRKQEQCAVCSVEDRGLGIAPEAVPHLFDRYYRGAAVRKSVRGVGLGLSMVKHIMDTHKGMVTVVSEPGRGSIFRISFPLAQGTKQ